MKKLLIALLLFCFQITKGQSIKARVIDAINNKPLSYAIVLYHNQERVIYTDINGYFSVAADSLTKDDIVSIQYVGFRTIFINVKDLKKRRVLRMVPDLQSLQPIVVTNCKRTRDFAVNKKVGRIKQYIGPGPETKFVIISRYNNNSGRSGWLKKISLLIDETSPVLKIPIRLRWYEWDVDNKMPGKELTDTNVVVYPYREGWNNFELPGGTIHCAKDWLVFGLEFIYPPEYKQHFDSLKTDAEKIKWLNNMKNRWSLAMQYVRNENETGFYIVNNADIRRYDKKYDRYFVRPAVKFSIEICAE